ncbi:MAG: AMP-binding protein, partial [Rikenellaceae bacterium]
MNNSKYYQPEIETLSRQGIEQLQVDRLRKSIDQAKRSPFYSKQLAAIESAKINSVDDIRSLPFTTKADLRENYPFGLNAVDQSEIVRLHSSSGTTGNPTVICHSKHDIDCWANRLARCLYMVGLRNTDVFQNTSGYGMFTGGLGFQNAAEWLGALTVPAATGNSPRQIKFITDFGTTAIHAIPSYAIRLAEVFNQLGIEVKRDTKLTTLIIGAEPHTEQQRRKIEQMLSVKAYNCFGMSEMSGPGVAFECTEQSGLHIWEDSFLVEIIDPD